MRILFTIALIISSYFAYTQKETIPDEGMTISFGFNSAIPTNEVLFKNWKSDDVLIQRQTLLSEWHSPKLGGHIDFLSRMKTRGVHFLGFQYNWQTLYASSVPLTSLLESFPDMGEGYRLTRKAKLNNFLIFTDHRVLNYKKLNLYVRADVGFANYKMKNYFHTSGSQKKLDRNFQSNYSLSFGSALSLRYQFNELFALNLLAGYRFNTANNFVRRSYLTSLNGTVDMPNERPENLTFEIIEGNSFSRPMKPKNEYLYVQFSIIRRLNLTNDYRNFSHSMSRREIGEPRVDPATAEKPILYLYPEDTTTVHVAVNLNQHDFIFTYPHYPEQGWEVIAAPSGNLFDLNTKRNYYSLFWETEGIPIATDLTEGFLVKGEETREFLEEKLAYLGLNDHEMNEFIIYWLPKMESNPYNAIHFAFDDYEAISQLEITPTPSCLIRIMMLFTPLEKPISLTPQIIKKAPERKGFVAVEWGGMKGEFFNMYNQ